MTIILACGALAVASVLVAGALSKAVDPRPFVSMLEALGVPENVARPLWVTVPCLELGAAAALLIAPGWLASQLLTLGVFACFAAAGVVGLRSGRSIACACFGSHSRATLGWPQLVQIVPVVIVLALLAGHEATWNAQAGVALLTGAFAVAGLALGARGAPLWWETRAMRVSLQNTRIASRRVGLEASDG